MPVTINGDGSITGLAVGGLPDGCVDTDTLAANAVTKAKRVHSSGEIVQTQSFIFTSVTENFTSRAWHGTSVTKQITPTSSSNKILVMATLTAGTAAPAAKVSASTQPSGSPPTANPVIVPSPLIAVSYTHLTLPTKA